MKGRTAEPLSKTTINHTLLTHTPWRRAFCDRLPKIAVADSTLIKSRPNLATVILLDLLAVRVQGKHTKTEAHRQAYTHDDDTYILFLFKMSEVKPPKNPDVAMSMVEEKRGWRLRWNALKWNIMFRHTHKHARTNVALQKVRQFVCAVLFLRDDGGCLSWFICWFIRCLFNWLCVWCVCVCACVYRCTFNRTRTCVYS